MTFFSIRYFDGPQITLIDVKEISFIRLLLDFKADPNIPGNFLIVLVILIIIIFTLK